MRNLIFLVLFLCLIAGLIFWLWTDRGDEQTLEEALADKQVSTEMNANEIPQIDMDEVEIVYDENGLVLKTLYRQEVNLTLSTNPVRNVEVYEGIMTYEEQTNGQWNFRSYNLAQYIQTNFQDIEL
jgi:phage pi2 protein 07